VLYVKASTVSLGPHDTLIFNKRDTMLFFSEDSFEYAKGTVCGFAFEWEMVESLSTVRSVFQELNRCKMDIYKTN